VTGPTDGSAAPRHLRIALIAFDFAEYCIPIANALARRSDVTLLLPESQVAPVRGEIDSTVKFMPFHKPRLRQALRQIRMCLDILRKIKKARPDVLHVQQGHLWFNLVLRVLRGYPLVLTIHDHSHHLGDRGSRRTPQFILNLGFRRADQLIVHGRRLREEVIEQLGFERRAIHVIRCLERAGVAPLSANGYVRATPDADQDERTILFFGRLWPYKGLDYLIRAEPLISARVPDLRIVVAGEGEDFERYRRLMRHPERFVVHNEFVSNEKRADLFRSASVVVLPYVEATQSGVVPVAYAFGKPVVTTDVGGLPEHVENEHTGLVVPPRDESALADAIIRLLEDRELRHRLGAAGKKQVHAECSAESVAQKTLAVYEQALKRRKTSGVGA
jgi:glycosyltransferase involved in cell wall biosynthesis